MYLIHTCTATRILYVLPDNVSDVNCPSQLCATLGQYLLDNGSLPVLSNVEYHFLPGEHHVFNSIRMERAINLSLIGFGLPSAKLVCKSLSCSYVSVFYSYNVFIRNLVFDQCCGVLKYRFPKYIAASLFLIVCSHCQVEDIKFFGYGFVGVNLHKNSYLNNITIDITTVRHTVYMCSQKFYLISLNVEDDYDYILINKIFITGYIESCYVGHKLMEIEQYKRYGMHFELSNSQFYNTTQVALFIRMTSTNGSLLVKNCNFTKVIHNVLLLHCVISSEIQANNVTIKFQNCAFYYNVAFYLLQLNFAYDRNLKLRPSNVTIEGCTFTDNYVHGVIIATLKIIDSHNLPQFRANVFFNDLVNFSNNTVHYIMHFTHVTAKMNGTITVLENIVEFSIMDFSLCEITFTKTIIFLSNVCDIIIDISYDMHYIVVMEYTNIIFDNNTCQKFINCQSTKNYIDVFPYCIFQYMVLPNSKSNVNELLKLYKINVTGSHQVKNASTYSSAIQANDLMTHCKWLPNAVFDGYNPGFINQQIIQIDGNHWTHYKKICVCPYDRNYNCNADQLGPVYPGQVLKVDLCMPQVITNEENSYRLFVETHATLLNSTCKIAHQRELINTITNHPKTFHFTIVSDRQLCELFFVVQNYIRAAFYVQLLSCPVGFTLQNGVCICDPLLPSDIDTCYIDLSAIRRPANTWITAHTPANNVTKYLISDCPMDYCLPYFTNVNLLYPDLQCQFNRTGLLCSQCQHPLSMVFGSSKCMKCTNVHILIIIIVLVAGIVLVVLLYVLNLTVTNGTINGIIFYANIISINDSVFLVNDNVFKPLKVFISFINLDLGIETCFYNGMDSYAKMWLQLFFPSYLILIAISIIIASRYSSRILRLTYSRSLPVLATLFLLSYTGVLRVVLTVLFSYSTITHYPSGDRQIVWSIDASVPLFSAKFTILFIICLVLFLLLIPFNITLLFTRYLSKFRIVNHFKPLLDAFQGSYKDKYYNWIAVQLILRSIFFSLYAFQIKLSLILATIILVIFTSYYGYLQPNKCKMKNFQELLVLINLTILYTISIQENDMIFSIISNAMIGLVLLQFNAIMFYHLFAYTYHCKFSYIKDQLITLLNRKKLNHHSFDVSLLDIPECTYNYSEYQDGLVSDDFNNHQ